MKKLIKTIIAYNVLAFLILIMFTGVWIALAPLITQLAIMVTLGIMYNNES